MSCQGGSVRIWTQPKYSRENIYVIISAPAAKLREGWVCFNQRLAPPSLHPLIHRHRPPRLNGLVDGVLSNQAHSTVRPLPFTGERPMRKLYILNIHYISRALRITWSFRAKSDSRPEGEVSLQEAERDARNNGGEWKPLKTHRITCLSGFILQLKEGEVKIICFTFVVRVSCSF